MRLRDKLDFFEPLATSLSPWFLSTDNVGRFCQWAKKPKLT